MNCIFVLIKSTLALSILSLTVYADNGYPTSKLNGMVGFAKEGGTTGGWNGKIVQINTLDDFKKCVGDGTPQVLVINQNIQAPKMTIIYLGSNKSIIGNYKMPVLMNIYLHTTEKSGNIIFQNLVFQHSAEIKGNDDKQIYITSGNNYWIDHCSFVGHKWSSNDGSLDKLLYVAGSADYVTLSNSYFANHKYGIILGYPKDTPDGKKYEGKPRMTIANNRYENIEVRGPGLMRYGEYHVYNNYMKNLKQCITVHTDAKILSENNYFENIPGNLILDDKAQGLFADQGSFPKITGQKSPKCAPFIKYPYKVIPVDKVKAFTTAHAGAQKGALVFGS